MKKNESVDDFYLKFFFKNAFVDEAITAPPHKIAQGKTPGIITKLKIITMKTRLFTFEIIKVSESNNQLVNAIVRCGNVISKKGWLWVNEEKKVGDKFTEELNNVSVIEMTTEKGNCKVLVCE